jgi:hypothetical protein
MDKIKVYDDFLKSLRIAMTNSSVYFKEHPLFIGSIENLQKNIKKVSSLLKPLRIGIASNYLLLGDQRLKSKRLYGEIIDFFHLRKIKSIEIKEEVSVDELLTFLIQANSSSRDILRAGGLENILKKKGVSSITVEGLDYSQLLRGQGEEFKDVWLYLLEEGLKQKDTGQISKLTADFEKVAAKFDAKDLLDDAEKGAVVDKLLDYLKDKDRDKFSECTKGLAKAILATKHLAEDVDISGLKHYFLDLSGEDIGDILLEQLKDEDAVVSLNFDLFSRLIDNQKHKEAASFLADKLKSQDLANKPQMAAKMKELFSLPDNPYVSKVYQENLSSMLEGISLGEGFSFDQGHLQNNYSVILLELLYREVDQKRLSLVLDKIFIEIDRAIEDKNIEYVKNFLEVLDKKRKELPLLESIFSQADTKLFAFIERAILKKHHPLELKSFMDRLEKSSLKSSDYLDVIFDEGRISPAILELFFKFFPQGLDLFYERLDRRLTNIAFVEKIIENLTKVKAALSLGVLKHIFYLSNDFIKIEVLKAMQDFGFCDEVFLFSILKSKNFYQRKHALQGLVKNSQSKKEAARQLLFISNILGFRTRVIEENLKIISDNPFKEAKEYLYHLTQYKFFWNKRISENAKRIIEKYES